MSLDDETLYQLRKHEDDIDCAGAADEIVSLRRQLEAATKACDDLNVQCRFWRQCAEHAVTGWNRLEDELELLKETLRALTREDAPEA